MLVEVHHHDFPTGPDRLTLVARVTVPDGADHARALEDAYRLTQNLEGSWSMGHHLPGGRPNPDWSANVERVAPLHVHDGKEYGLRSSMMDDVFVIEGRRYLCATVGFREVPTRAD
jgi:hypothetical protein